MNIQKKKDSFIYLILLFLASVIVFIWFKDQKILATGEEALVSANFTRAFQHFLSPWLDINLGVVTPFYIARIPFFAFAGFLNLFIPSWIVQLISYWLLILSGLLGMYLLSKQLVKNNFVALVATVFYFLNLYSQSQIWNRALLTGMFAWAYLPIFLFCWINWIGSGKLRWLVGLLLSSFIFSLTFGIVAYVFTFWIPAGIWVLFELIRNRDKKFIFSILLRSVIGVMLWALTNIWWIYPVLTIQSTALGNAVSWKSNFDSLRGVSSFFPTEQIVLLRQSFLFGDQSIWYGYYLRQSILLWSLLVLFFVVIGTFKARKEKPWWFLIILLAIGWFVSKGSNPPLGSEFYSFLFANIPITMVLRNPYEKFGLVFLLPYSIFFGIGVYSIYNKISPSLRSTLLVASFVTCFGALVLPMWNASLYKNSKVIIPAYYQNLNEYLSQDASYSRILVLPLIAGDSVKYTWGYRGLESSQFLFDKPSIASYVLAPYVDEKYMQLYNKMINKQVITPDLSKLAVKYIVLHNDYDATASLASPSGEVAETLKYDPRIKFVKSFGKLNLYQSTDPISLFVAEGKSKPEISNERIGPSAYLIKIVGASEPFTLVFKQTFHNNWKLTIDSKEVENHTVTYGYANGWKINRKGTYTAYLNFKVWPWE